MGLPITVFHGSLNLEKCAQAASPTPFSSTVYICCIPHHTGVIRNDDEGPNVLGLDPQLLLSVPLQLQVVVAQLFDQEVGSPCGGQVT